MARITRPTEGWAEIHGRVGSLLEVGTGFHPELTGRENVYLSGAILGMRKLRDLAKIRRDRRLRGSRTFSRHSTQTLQQRHADAPGFCRRCTSRA